MPVSQMTMCIEFCMLFGIHTCSIVAVEIDLLYHSTSMTVNL